ncbi:MAG: hypothetical protein MJE12_17345 [Alphaproteobacteria bacterium]|nr:hypothetical protein [Alphaproteobacteria bacterium]
MRYSDEDLENIQRFVELTRKKVATRDLTLKISNDPQAFVDCLADQDFTHGIPTTHDPAKSDVRPGNFFWIYLLHRTGVAATHGLRCVKTDDLMEDIRANTVFFDSTPLLDYQPLDFHPEAKYIPLISGNVVMGGGYWIRKDFRGRWATPYFGRVGRALAARQFKMDWYASFFLNTPDRRDFGQKGAGISEAKPLLKGHYPPYGDKEVDIQLMYMNKDQFVEQIALDCTALSIAA